MSKRILVIGCGDIGSRHLQAAVAVEGVSGIDVVDSRPESLAIGRQRIAEVGHAVPGLDIRWLTSLDDVKPADVCIVATRARGRAALVRAAADRGARSFLIEKVVTTSAGEYADLLAFAESRELPVWVNCKTRAYPFHQRMRAQFAGGGPIQFTVLAGNHGLACNGLHSADLFVYYDGADAITPVSAAIDPVLHPSKRGDGIFDVSGTMTAVSNRGSLLVLSFAQDHMGPPVYLVSSARQRFVLDQWQPFVHESAADTWTWRPSGFDGNLLISHMTRDFLIDILAHGRCDLPTLRECAPAHTYLLTALQPSFSALMGTEMEELPVT